MNIRPYEKNAKKHPDKQLEQIARSLAEFGWQQPIVVDKAGVIIVGHGRWAAYQKFGQEFGIKEPEIRTADLTEEQAKAYRLADNKLNESDWDMSLVVEELKGLSVEMIDLTGFDRDLVIEDDEKDDVVPLLPEAARSKVGDVFQLGRHKLMVGDSTNPEHVATLFAGHKADMVFTDPPYNVNYKGQGENTSNGILNDKMSASDFDIFLSKVFKNYKDIIKAGGGMYVFHSTSTQAQFEKHITDNGFAIKNQLIWNKPMAALGWGDYRWKHEPFYYCGVAGHETQFYGDRTHATVIDFQKSDKDLERWAKKVKKLEAEGKSTIWTMKREKVGEYVHPTQKPVELITYALVNSSKADDLVADLFLGSGATLIACEKTNRTCYGMELDPRYADVIVRRYCDYIESDEIILNGQKTKW